MSEPEEVVLKKDLIIDDIVVAEKGVIISKGGMGIYGHFLLYYTLTNKKTGSTAKYPEMNFTYKNHENQIIKFDNRDIWNEALKQL